MRLVTLTGPGGTGKTRLALAGRGRAARRLRAIGSASSTWRRSATRRWWPRRSRRRWACERAAGSRCSTRLKDYLRDKQLLLLLDNFEQVRRRGAAGRRAAGGRARAEVLVTSRAALHLSGEQEYAVPPLAAARPAPICRRSNAWREYEAVQLFVERAQAVKANFRAHH